MFLPFRLPILVGLLAASLVSIPAAAQIQVSATIRPLQLIAAAITDGVSEPSLILGAGQDPHHPVLRPSQRQAMADADVLLWVGPPLENALANAIAGLNRSVIGAFAVVRTAGLIPANASDPHIWLDTRNALAVAQTLTRELERLDEANAPSYRRNLRAFTTQVNELEEAIQDRMEDIRQQPFAVYHNAFRYYERQFDLRNVAAFTGNEATRPGIRQFLEIQAVLREHNVRCILLEPEVNPDEISQVLESDHIHYASIDVLGAGFVPSRDGYSHFMRKLTDDIAACLEA